MGRELEIEIGDVEKSADGARCTVKIRVPHDARYFEGHFPGQPILPGIAQLVALVYEPATRAWPDLPAPKSVKRLKFLEALKPGDELEVRLRREQGKLRFEIRRSDLLCSQGVLTF